MLAKATLVALLALAATSLADPVSPRENMLSSAVRKALESLRPHLKDLPIPSQTTEVKDSKANLTVSLEDGVAEKLEKFIIFRIESSIISLAVTNLTIIFDEVKIYGQYSMKGSLALPDKTDNTPVDGKGKAKVELKRVFTTIAAKFVLSGNKVQIAPKGLYGFDVYVKESKFQLENSCGEKGEDLSEYFSANFPEYVNKVKNPLFNEYRDVLIKIINKYLAEATLDAAGCDGVVDC